MSEEDLGDGQPQPVTALLSCNNTQLTGWGQTGLMTGWGRESEPLKGLCRQSATPELPGVHGLLGNRTWYFCVFNVHSEN